MNSNCTNTFGSYECSCFSGYYDEGMGYVCTGMFVDLSFLHDLFIIDIQILMNVWMLHVTLMPHATTRWGVTPVNVGVGFLGMDLIALVCFSVCI